MKLKKLLSIVLAVLMVLTLCSCGKVTAESLIADMIKAVAKEESFSGTMEMNMDMELSLLGESLGMSMVMDADVAYHSGTTYSVGVSTAVTDGEEPVITETEGYTVIDEDTMTTYSLVGDTWHKMTSETGSVDMSDYLGTVVKLLDPENRGEIVLLDETEMYAGKEVYVLTIEDCNYPELAIDTVFSQLESIFGEIDPASLDFSDITMSVTLWVYKDTKLPAYLAIDFGDSFSSVMDTMMDAIMESLAEQFAGYDLDIAEIFAGLEFSVAVPNAAIYVGFDEYGIEPIEVPQEALSAEELIPEGSSIFDNMLMMQ